MTRTLLFSGVDLGSCAGSKRWDALDLVVRTQVHPMDRVQREPLWLFSCWYLASRSFPPYYPFLLSGLVCSDYCTFPAESVQLKDLGKCLLLAILDTHFYPVLYQYNGLVVAAQRDPWIVYSVSPC